MKIAIYSRKSKFTGKGESVENQVEIAKEYAKAHFDDEEKDILIYEDEGFSGGSTDRPDFQRMMLDAKTKKFDVLICYRLDRLSRSVVDFAATMEELQKYNIEFVSIREQFDTSTPMGRAMMYIASVFAQLERETAAERIRDNMIELAKTGRWLGGVTPTGFESEPVTYLNEAGKEKTMFKLTPIKEELKMVQLIFDKFLELKSLTKLEQFCTINNLKTKNGVDYKRYSLRLILSNPVYAVADEKTYDFLIEMGCEIYCEKEKFNGEFGIMAYNKTEQGENFSAVKTRDVSEWIVAVGAHKGTVSSDKWIKVQKLLLRNKSKSFRKVRNTTCLLSGVLKCKDCGSYMRPRSGRKNKDGVFVYYYMCELKERSKRTKCAIKNAHGNKLDKAIIEELKNLSLPKSTLSKTIQGDKITIQTTQNSIEKEIMMLKDGIRDNELAINNLVSFLSQEQESDAAKYIIKRIEELDKQTATMKDKLLKLQESKEANEQKDERLDIIKNMLSSFAENLELVDVEAKRTFIKSIVEKVTWDGKNAEIFLFGGTPGKKLQPPMEKK
ncbi:MAG TPA: recombinase family protein [Clostridiaceae bacterium]|nr:recombinase family protein [Clostridiaceae bacterium]